MNFNVIGSKDIGRLRRLALYSQGLLQAKPFGSGLSAAIRAVEHIGYVQIDTISVVERAHNHVLYSRVPNFKPTMTNKMLRNRDIFEYWSHAAAFLPIHDFRYSLPYKNAIKAGQVHWYKNPNKKHMRELLARIQSDGPLRSRDLEDVVKHRTGWWDLKPAKKALEQLYMEGDLMVSNRDGFQKTYDLTERVLPEGINTQTPSMGEFAEHLVDQQLRCHGLVSLKGATYLRKNRELRKAVKALIDERLALGELEHVAVGDDTFVIESGALESAMPRVRNRLVILSPFDNSVIQRDRLKVLFQFDYQIECYVPEAKRQFGYFSLPLLFRDQFIGRMDCKAHRKDRHLEIKSLHIEPHDFDTDLVVSSFIDALSLFCEFQGCVKVSLRESRQLKIMRFLESEIKHALG